MSNIRHRPFLYTNRIDNVIKMGLNVSIRVALYIEATYPVESRISVVVTSKYVANDNIEYTTNNTLTLSKGSTVNATYIGDISENDIKSITCSITSIEHYLDNTYKYIAGPDVSWNREETS